MAHKIDGFTPDPQAARGPSATPPVANGGSARAREEATAVAPADSVQLTPAAQSLQRVEAELKGSEAFDARRVAELRAAIEAGTYRTDPVAVAKGLVQIERLLGGR